MDIDKKMDDLFFIPRDQAHICRRLLTFKALGLKKVVFEILYPHIEKAKEEWGVSYSFLLKKLKENHDIDFSYRTFLAYKKAFKAPNDTVSAKEKKKNSQNFSRLGNYGEKNEYNSDTEAEGFVHAASFDVGLTDARANRQPETNSPLTCDNLDAHMRSGAQPQTTPLNLTELCFSDFYGIPFPPPPPFTKEDFKKYGASPVGVPMKYPIEHLFRRKKKPYWYDLYHPEELEKVKREIERMGGEKPDVLAFPDVWELTMDVDDPDIVYGDEELHFLYYLLYRLVKMGFPTDSDAVLKTANLFVTGFRRRREEIKPRKKEKPVFAPPESGSITHDLREKYRKVMERAEECLRKHAKIL